MSLALSLAALALVGLGPMVLTFQGARRRGQAIGPAAFAGLFFPVTWAVWYVRDEDPYHLSGPVVGAERTDRESDRGRHGDTLPS